MDNVNKTLYIPIYGKAYVSKKGIILKDTKAEEIWEKEAFPRIQAGCRGFKTELNKFVKDFCIDEATLGYLIGWVLERKQTSFHVPSIDRL